MVERWYNNFIQLPAIGKSIMPVLTYIGKAFREKSTAPWLVENPPIPDEDLANHGPPPHQILEDPANPMAFWQRRNSQWEGVSMRESGTLWKKKIRNFSVEWVWYQDFWAHDLKNAEALHFQSG